MNDLKKTPFHAMHVELGARMVEFGGWLMPVFYSNLIEEHLNTREKAGLFDICQRHICVRQRDIQCFERALCCVPYGRIADILDQSGSTTPKTADSLT